MATASATRPQIASPQIFTSDPLERTFAAGLAERDTGGNSGALYALMKGAQATREAGQEQYLKGLAEANRMQMLLSRQQDEADLGKAMIAHAAEISNAGIPIEQFKPSATVMYAAGMDPQTRQASLLAILKRQAEIAHLYAQAANAGAGSADKTTYQENRDVEGRPIGSTVTLTTKGNPANLGPRASTVGSNPGVTIAPPGTTPGGATRAPNPPASVPSTTPSTTPLTQSQQRELERMRAQQGAHRLPGTTYGQ